MELPLRGSDGGELIASAADASVRRRGVYRMLTAFRVLVLLCAGFPSRQWLCRQSAARGLWGAATGARVLFNAITTIINRTKSVHSTQGVLRLASAVAVATALVRVMLFATTPYLLLRKIPGTRTLRGHHPEPRTFEDLLRTRPVPALDAAALLSLLTFAVATAFYVEDWQEALHGGLQTMDACGSVAALLAVASACQVCVAEVHDWFDSAIASQPAIVNLGMRAPLKPHAADSRAAAGAASLDRPAVPADAGARAEQWLDGLRFSYHAAARTLQDVSTACSPGLLASCVVFALNMVDSVLQLATGRFDDAGFEAIAGLVAVYLAAVALLVGVMASASSVAHVARARCADLDVALFHVPVAAVHSVQRFAQERALAFTLFGYPLMRADLARLVITAAGAGIPAAVRALT